MSFRKIEPAEINRDPFTLFGKDWLLLTAEADGVANPMTVGWGGLGVMWGKNVVFAVVRPERYTHELLDKTDVFSLVATRDRGVLGYCGKTSGRDGDKVKSQGLTLLHEDGAPYFEEAELVICCKKLYADDFSEEKFTDGGELAKKWYGGGYHTLYIAEIVSVLVKED